MKKLHVVNKSSFDISEFSKHLREIDDGLKNLSDINKEERDIDTLLNDQK